MSCMGYSMLKNIATLKSWSRVNQSGTIRYIAYGFPIVSLSLRYSTCKCTVTLKSGLGKPTRIDPPHDFMLTFRGNYVPISYHFRDKRRFQSKIANGPGYFAPPMKRSSWNWVSALREQGSKTSIMGLPGRERCVMISSAV